MSAICSSKFSFGFSAPVAKRSAKACSTRPFLARARAVRVQAAVKPPQGVSLPPQEPTPTPATFGFVDWAEKINGRVAMIAFFVLLAIEGVANKGVLEVREPLSSVSI